MKKIFLGLFIVLSLQTISAQDHKNFYHEVYQADKLFQQGDLNGALLGYEAASEKARFVPTRILKKFLKVAKEANHIPLKKKFKSLIAVQKKCPSENTHLGVKLDSLMAEDTRVRTKKRKLIRYYWKNVDTESVKNSSKFIRAKNARMDWKRTDSLNILILLSMFEEYGFLDEKKVGYDKQRYVQHILLHFDKDTSNVVLQPILDKALANGQITPGRYALILDRHLYACRLPQKFYAWPMLRSNPELSKEDITEIIKLRESIGMYGTELTILEARGHWQLKNTGMTSY